MTTRTAENLLRNRLHRWIFFQRKATTTHTNVFFAHPSDGPTFKVCQAKDFQWLMEMFSHLRYYICFSSTTPLLPSDLHPDDIPVWPASSRPCTERDGLIYIIWAALGLREQKGSHKNSGTLDAHLKSDIFSYISKRRLRIA